MKFLVVRIKIGDILIMFLRLSIYILQLYAMEIKLIHPVTVEIKVFRFRYLDHFTIISVYRFLEYITGNGLN